ncbi:TolC family protein [Runella slithyformis]|uniref:Outer membrane efflux protein n=1 Tax=Runella slithyformis (strain ATCC 29530 / DSM 19594 / LMG 11500 / NCIMB 11436 / LSU 4) TaxID=761193 RepID=A0A7U4E7L3_RUNSL|nr:TolC family protein [Runella slithyformis]AEI50428.1 outer membrane efflux protein [Runella slithyformis DSM 19594]
MKRITAFLLLFVGACITGSAQQSMSLKESIDYGLQHYGTVRIAQYQVETANQQARQALGQYLPQVSATGNFTDNLKLQTTLLPAGFAGPEPTRISLGSKYQTNLSGQLTQTIYDKSLLIGIKANEANQKLADLNVRQTREEIIYNIADNYYQVFIAQQQVALLKDNLERTQQVLNILKLQRDNGVIQPIDYTNTEVSFNNTRSQLALSQNTLELALNRLKYQMGMSQDQELKLSDTLLLKEKPLPSIEPTSFNAPNLISYQKAVANLDLQRLQMKRTKAGYQPTLNFTANYGTLALGNQFGDIFHKYTGFGSIGLRLNIPIFDGFQRDAQIQQNRLTVMTQEVQLRLNTSAYQLQFSNAQSQIQKSQTNIQNDDRNVKLAQEVYNITTLQYKQGTKSLTDLINADNSYRQAQSNYINSLINFYRARLDLEQSQGSLLTFYNSL